MPGPRAEASSVPSPATRATSVLLFPPSMASTAGLSSRGRDRGSSGLPGKDPGKEPGKDPGKDSAKVGPAQGECEQGRGGVVVGGLHRGPGHHVVLVTHGRVVER